MLLDARKAADFLGVKETTLAILRSRGVGAPFIRKGINVFYESEDLERYPAIKTQAQRYGNAARQMYTIRALRDGELHSIHKRRGVNLEHAVEILSQYPSMAGCSFEMVQPPKVQPNQIERFRNEMDKAKPELKEAIRKTIDGPSAAAKQSGSNQFDKVLERAIARAFN